MDPDRQYSQACHSWNIPSDLTQNTSYSSPNFHEPNSEGYDTPHHALSYVSASELYSGSSLEFDKYFVGYHGTSSPSISGLKYTKTWKWDWRNEQTELLNETCNVGHHSRSGHYEAQDSISALTDPIYDWQDHAMFCNDRHPAELCSLGFNLETPNEQTNIFRTDCDDYRSNSITDAAMEYSKSTTGDMKIPTPEPEHDVSSLSSDPSELFDRDLAYFDGSFFHTQAISPVQMHTNAFEESMALEGFTASQGFVSPYILATTQQQVSETRLHREPVERVRRGKHHDSNQSNSSDNLLLRLRDQGMNYKAILQHREFRGISESTLRGRVRNLRKPKELRLRKPQWPPEAVSALLEAVDIYSERQNCNDHAASKDSLTGVPWKKVADWMVQYRGCYPYGNATVKKKFSELVDQRGQNSTLRGVNELSLRYISNLKF